MINNISLGDKKEYFKLQDIYIYYIFIYLYLYIYILHKHISKFKNLLLEIRISFLNFQKKSNESSKKRVHPSNFPIFNNLKNRTDPLENR